MVFSWSHFVFSAFSSQHLPILPCGFVGITGSQPVTDDLLSPWFLFIWPLLFLDMPSYGPVSLQVSVPFWFRPFQPQLCCLKVRSIVIFFSILGLILCLWEAIFNEDMVTMITGAVSAVLEVVLLYGVIRNVAKYLKISMYISVSWWARVFCSETWNSFQLIHLTFDFGTILVSPVYFASHMASGYESNDTYPVLPLIIGAKSEEEDRFILGLITGYSVEIISTVSVFSQFLPLTIRSLPYFFQWQYSSSCSSIGATSTLRKRKMALLW